MTPLCCEEVTAQNPGGRDCLCICSFVWFVYVVVFPPGPPRYIFHTSMARCRLFVLKMSLNTNQTIHGFSAVFLYTVLLQVDISLQLDAVV